MSTTKSYPARPAATRGARAAGPDAGHLGPSGIDRADQIAGADQIDGADLDDQIDGADLDDADIAAEPAVDDPASGVRRLGVWLVLAGVLGFAAAFTLTVDKIRLIQDPTFSPSCNFNPIVNCGNVMKTGQAEVFGFPNSLIGVGAFAVLAAVGLALLAGARFRSWFWVGLAAGTVFGVGFVHWLAFQSMFRIGSLCPWCMVVWAVVLPSFVAVMSYAARTGQFGAGLVPAGRWLRRHTAEVLVVWFLVFVVAAGVRFWDFWQTFV